MGEDVNAKQVHRKRRIFRNILLVLAGLFLLIYAILYFGLNFFGEKVLREYLQQKIAVASDSLYAVDFDRLNLNVVNGNVRIYGFRMIPDTSRYNRMKAAGKVNKALYELRYESLSIVRLHILELINTRRVNIREMILSRPEMTMVAFPDSSVARQGKLNTLYRDMYPLASMVFQDFHVDSIKVVHGYILSERRQKSGKLNEGEYEFSATLRNFSVNPYSFYNPDRVFYSTGIDIAIHNYSFSLADSLYFLTASEIGFSLKEGYLYGRNIELKPNFRMPGIGKIDAGNLIQLNLPSFRIDGIDLYEVLTRQVVDLTDLKLDDLRVKLFRLHSKKKVLAKSTDQRKKLNLADLYTVIRGKLNSVAIDTILITNTSFEFYSSIWDDNPEISVARATLKLTGGQLDSLAALRKDRILYGHDLEVEMRDIAMRLRDSVHILEASRVYLSTQLKRFSVSDAMIFPGQDGPRNPSTGRSMTLTAKIPDILFTELDLKELYHDKIFEFRALHIGEPDLQLVSFGKRPVEKGRFSKASDFFAEENQDFIFVLLKKYLNGIYGDTATISHGFIGIKTDHHGVQGRLVSGLFDLQLFDFTIDSASKMNDQGYFYSREFNLAVNQLLFQKPDSSTRLTISSAHLVTRDSLIRIEGFSFIRNSGGQKGFSFQTNRLMLVGLNHKKLFLEKVVSAGTLVLDHPKLDISASHFKAVPDTLQQHLPSVNDFFRQINLKDLEIRKGDIRFEHAGKQSDQSFSLSQLDFVIRKPILELPAGEMPGNFSFETLELYAKPLKAVLGDSAYQVEIGSLSMNSYPVDIVLEHLKVHRLFPGHGIHAPKVLEQMDVERLAIHGFYFDQAIFRHQWSIDSLVLDQPFFRLHISDSGKHPGQEQPGKIVLPPFMKVFKLKELVMREGKLELLTGTAENPSINTFMIPQLRVGSLQLDSVTYLRRKSDVLNIPASLTVASSGMEWLSGDSLYHFSFSGFRFSTAESYLEIDSFMMAPALSDSQFDARTPYQHDRLTIRIPSVIFKRFDYHSLINERRFNTGLIELNGVMLENYRDKRKPLDPLKRPPNPVQRINHLKPRVNVDTVLIKGPGFTYSEQRGNVPGTLFFSDIFMMINGVTNDTLEITKGSFMNILFRGKLMGEGAVDAMVKFPLIHRGDSFSVSGTVGSFNLTALNPLVSNLLPLTITKGNLHRIDILNFKADTSIARGRLNFYHSDIRFKLIPDKALNWNSLETGILNLLLNEFIPASNPKETGKFTRGIIFFRRDPEKGFFNYVWKGVQSGLKSSLGLNDKDQRIYLKEVKKDERSSKRKFKP